MDEFFMVYIRADKQVGNNYINVNKNLANTLGLEANKEMTFFVGQTKQRLTVQINSSASSSQTINLSPLNLKKLFLKRRKKYGIRCNEDEIHVGPVVGIMADVYKEPERPFGGQSHFIKQLLMSGNSIGQICFAFSPYSIDVTKGLVKGYSHGSKGWVKGTFPIPDVIYPRDRAYSRSRLQIRKRAENMGIALLNPTLVGKWESHKILMQNPKLKEFLPETKLVKDFSEVEQMLRIHNAVYLKPVAGSQGRGIIKVVKRKSRGFYEYRYVLEERMVKGSAYSRVNLQRSLRRIMGNRSYIVQKQINLLKYDGNIIDVRVLVQKDHTGEWDVTGIASRVGKNGSITSNISSGGSGRKIEQILNRNKYDANEQIRIIDDIHYVSIEVTKTLEKSIGQSGEMGVDLGIDTNGKVWFIEANIRPARHVFNLIGEPETRLRSVEKPMLYARYLAGF
ncbi:MAG TPA: YheC/YheD family protein [Syntrophomonadaceae bacterium]|nr:YheC/YheD family protein [Syntrophomonadaceae bacterium]